MTEIVHTSDWSDQALRDVIEYAHRLDVNVVDWLGVMFSESECRAGAANHNAAGHVIAAGLNQLTEPAMQAAGWSGGLEAFAQLTAEEQLPYVYRYFAGHAPLLTLARAYVANFLPALLDHADEVTYVLCAQHGPLAWAYAANRRAFDPDGHGYITVQSIVDRVRRATISSPRWTELLLRLNDVAPATVPEVDEGRVLSMQEALRALGYDPGPLDGVNGPRTEAALDAFRRDQLVTDDAGTAKALAQALRDRARDLTSLAEEVAA